MLTRRTESGLGMAASRAPKSPEKAMAIILFSILALVIVLMSLTSSADLRVHEGHLTHRDPRTFAMHRKERLGRRNSVDDVEGDVRVSKRRHDDDDGGDIDDDEDDDDDDDRKERGSRASSSSTLPSRRVEDPFGLPHFKTHEVRDDPVGSWVHHAWEATEHVVDEFAEEFEEFGEDTARVFEPRGKMNSFGDWKEGIIRQQRCEAKEATALERDRRFEHRGRVVRGGTTTREGGASGRRGEW